MTGDIGQLRYYYPLDWKTHKGNQIVNEDQGKADNGKIKDMSPVGEVRLLTELVLGEHDAGRGKVSQHYTTKNDQDILGNPSPWRVACAQKGRLCVSV